MQAQIFAEGFDIKFISDLSKFLNLPSRFAINSTDGWTQLNKVQSKFHEATDKNIPNLVIFDADANIVERRTQLEERATNLDIDFALFLLPNNQDSGALEDLLLQIIPTDRLPLVNCLDAYVACVGNHRPGFQMSAKSRLFAYLEAIGEGKVLKVDFLNPNNWDLNRPILNSLKTFLQQNIPAH